MRKSLLLLVLIAGCTRASEVDSELQRLETMQRALPAREFAKATGDLITAAQKSTDPQLRLYRLREAYVALETVTKFAQLKPQVKDVAALEKVWKQMPVPAPRKVDGSLLQKALYEAAHNRARKYYDASLPYGKASGAEDGLYYLAESDSNRKFAEWVAGLRTKDDGERPPEREQLRAALQSLEREAYEAFNAEPTVSRRVAGISARLKESRELLEQGSLAGATLTLLEAKHALQKTQPFSAEGEAKGSLEALWRAMAAEDKDGSVLALYDAMQGRRLAVATAAKGPVTVTLVRWPYT